MGKTEYITRQWLKDKGYIEDDLPFEPHNLYKRLGNKTYNIAEDNDGKFYLTIYQLNLVAEGGELVQKTETKLHSTLVETATQYKVLTSDI